jgi:hypothetical protein
MASKMGKLRENFYMNLEVFLSLSLFPSFSLIPLLTLLTQARLPTLVS